MKNLPNPQPELIPAWHPSAWRVVLRLRAVPGPGGAALPVTAFLGDIEGARRALLILASLVGPVCYVYMVNEDMVTPDERSRTWERLLWLAEEVDRAAAETTVTPLFHKKGWGPYSFGAPRHLYDRIGGPLGANLTGGWNLTRTVAWGYFRTRTEAHSVRLQFLRAQREEGLCDQ